MQSVVLTLIFGKIGMDIVVDEVSPWLDPGFRDQAEISERYAEQSHRRCIKTHTPLDGITYSPNCTYLAVYRHPMDAHFSMRKHMQNMKLDIEGLNSHYLDDIEGGFRNFLESESVALGHDLMSVASIVYHYKSTKLWSHLPNVHLFHYADMSRDLGREIKRLSQILGYDYPDDSIDKFVEANKFSTMKSNAVSHATPGGSATFKDEAEFFSSGTSNKWEKYLSKEQVASYDSRIRELAEEGDIEWLHWGAGGVA